MSIPEKFARYANSETVTSYEIHWTGKMYSGVREVPIVPIRYSDHAMARLDYEDMLRLVPKDEVGDHTLTYEQVDKLSHTVEEIAHDGIVNSVELHVVITTRTSHRLM